MCGTANVNSPRWVAFPVPLVGLTASHAGPVPPTVAVQSSTPGPLFEIVTVWFTGFTPSNVLKFRLVVLTVSTGGALKSRLVRAWHETEAGAPAPKAAHSSTCKAVSSG